VLAGLQTFDSDSPGPSMFWERNSGGLGGSARGVEPSARGGREGRRGVVDTLPALEEALLSFAGCALFVVRLDARVDRDGVI